MIDLNKRVIFKREDGGVSIIIPVECGLDLIDIIRKDVPIGSAYLVVNADVIPSDRSQRQAWTADFTNAAINTGVQP